MSTTVLSLGSLSGKTIAVRGSGPAVLTKRLEVAGAIIVGHLNSSVDVMIVAGGNADDTADDQRLAVSLGIPVLPLKFVMDQIIAENKSLKRKEEFDGKTNSRRSSKRQKINGDLPVVSAELKPSKSFSGQLREIQTAAMTQALNALVENRVESENKLLNRVIAFEGNIGAGKSTLCSKFKQVHPDKCSLYKEMGNEKFLQLFYSNPAKYGFAYQWGMLKTRRFQLSLAQHDSKHGRIPPKQFYFWDRSMVGDYIFALWNHLLGSISQQEMLVYEDEFGGSMKDVKSIPFLADVHCYVLLNDEPRHCKFRVEHHRGNKSEEGIPLPYYEGIDDIHFDLFVNRIISQKVAPAIVLSWGQYNNPKLLWNQLARVVGGVQECASVRHLDALPSQIEDDEIVYNTEEDILSFYNEIKWENPMDEKPSESMAAKQRMNKYVRAFFPRNLMRISEKDKGVVTVNDYNIRFYRNEFKRVVLWHLSQFQEVCFF